MATRTRKITKKTAKKVAKPAVKKAVPSALSAPLFTMAGKESGTIELPVALFGAVWNGDLVQQVVIGMQANARPVVANTKGRGEVRGGGKKPWKQKGTGRARHGSSRSPIWVGGGTTHGPTSERTFKVKINRKMRVAALASVLSRKFADGDIIFVDKFSFAEPKSKEAVTAITAIAKGAKVDTLASRKGASVLVALGGRDENAEKSFRNVKNITVNEARNMNPAALLAQKYLIIERPLEAFATLAARVTK